MSHQIRTPLDGVMKMTESLFSTELTARQKKYSDSIKKSAEILLAVIDDILDLSSIQSRRLRLCSDSFYFRDLVYQAVQTYTESSNAKGIEIFVLYHSDVRYNIQDSLIGDFIRVRQILANLVGNAVKFTEKGRVVIDVEWEKTGTIYNFLVKVSDTGIGIPEKLHRTIFDNFSQADTSSTRKFGGTGLGLAICSQLVNMMGGTIGVESTPGKGSTFFFRIELPAGTQTDQTDLRTSMDKSGENEGDYITGL